MLACPQGRHSRRDVVVNVGDDTDRLHASGVDGVFKVSMTTASGIQTVNFTGGKSAQDTGLKLSDRVITSMRE